MTLMQQVRDDYLRRLELTWPIERAIRRRLFLVCALPAFVVSAQLVEVGLAYVFSPVELFYAEEFEEFGGGPAEVWQRLYRFTVFVVQTLPPVTVGILFLAGILTWSRVQASWIFVFGAVLAGLALLLGSLATIVYTVTEDEGLISDIGADLWLDAARTFGLLSIGFFFVVYRTLAEREPVSGTEADFQSPPAASTE